MSDFTLSENLKERMATILEASPLVPVISIAEAAHAEPLTDALVAGGLRVLEITLRTPHGLDAIAAIRRRHPDIWVGAGTVASVEQYQAVEAAGGQFVVTPGSTAELLEYGTRASIPLLPGVATLSEMMEGYRLGYRDFKFFPAEVAGGVAALKAFAGPFAQVRFCPTGGIRRETAADYLALANVPAVGGTWLTPAAAIERADWPAISREVEVSIARLRQVAN
ncbi:bifunctional 4-hydroxy-2-oxoglutarate aldolase/2-dehydro-3-deoxy-phosphogluconate aldolase [Marinobacteraceae bacterium S3BR75-40.1]